MRTKEGQKLHDSFVAAVAGVLVKKRFNRVFADLPGRTKPPKLNGYIPDVYAVKVGTSLVGLPVVTAIFVVEVETEDTQSTPTTLLQHLALRKWAIDNRAAFEVVVAK